MPRNKKLAVWNTKRTWSELKVAQFHIMSDFFATLWTVSLPGSSLCGILQAGILEWVTIPFPKGFSWPSILCRSPALQASSLLSEPRVLTVLASRHAVWERRRETTGRMQALTPCSATKPEGKLWLVRTSDLWNYRKGNLSVWFEKLPSSLQHNFQRPSVPASSQSCCCEHVKWCLYKYFT